MYNYSPIKQLNIKNFRNLGDVSIDFTQSPIVTLVGENEAGKTSVIKAFSMCALHDSPRDQKDYIRDGTKRLGIEIALDDGTSIIRVKENGGINLYRIVYPDGKTWDATKITEGLPEPVSRAMGLIVEPETGEYLNVRTYEDKLLFVVTPNSTNYKVMYNALKVEQLTKAIKGGSNEANALKQKINQNESSTQTLYGQLRGITIVDTEPLTSVKDRLSEQLAALEKLESIMKLDKQLCDIERELGAIELINMYNLQPVDEAMAVKLNNISNTLNNLSNIDKKLTVYVDLGTLSEIDLGAYDKINSLIASVNKLNAINKDALLLEPVNNLEQISEGLVMHVNSGMGIVNQLNAIDSKLSLYDFTGAEEVKQSDLDAINVITGLMQSIEDNKQREANLTQYYTYIEQIQTYLKQCGVAVETCPKCGEDIIFDLDKMQ